MDLSAQTLEADGAYQLAVPGLTLPASGIVYVNVTGGDCDPVPVYPSGAPALPARQAAQAGVPAGGHVLHGRTLLVESAAGSQTCSARSTACVVLCMQQGCSMLLTMVPVGTEHSMSLCLPSARKCALLMHAQASAAWLPAGRVLKVHGYYDKRPALTLKYGVFDQRTWTAYVGMGNETAGSAIAGAPCAGRARHLTPPQLVPWQHGGVETCQGVPARRVDGACSRSARPALRQRQQPGMLLNSCAALVSAALPAAP